MVLVLQGLEVKVWRAYEDFVDELTARFPAERKGIEAFYGEAWRVFNALNSLELKSLEEPRYLLGGALALLRVWLACTAASTWGHLRNSFSHYFCQMPGKEDGRSL